MSISVGIYGLFEKTERSCRCSVVIRGPSEVQGTTEGGKGTYLIPCNRVQERGDTLIEEVEKHREVYDETPS